MKTSSRGGWWAKLAGVTTGVVVGTTVGVVGPAHASIGSFAHVYRSCGVNTIANGGGNGTYWAQTARDSGSCSGTLSVAMQSNDGYQSPRVYGNRDSAYTQLSNFNAVGSVHWGCNSCSPTYL